MIHKGVRIGIAGRIGLLALAIAWAAIVVPLSLRTFAAQNLQVAASRHLEWGRLEESRDVLQRAIELTPRNAELLAQLSTNLDAIARFRNSEEAASASVEALEAALRLKPLDPELHARLGRLHLGRDDLHRAEPYLERARELDPHNAYVLGALGRLREAQGEDEAAIRLYRRALEIVTDRELRTRLRWLTDR